MHESWLGALRLATIAALVTCAGEARAQWAIDLAPASTNQPGSNGADALQQQSYWGLGATRLFVSSTIDVGYLYVRPQIAVGYGKPHWSWVGAELYSAISPGGAAEYGGLRAMLRHVDIRLGGRYLFTTSRHFLTPRASYRRPDVDIQLGPPSRYVALDAEVSFSVPMPVGSIFGLASAHGIFGVPERMFVMEEGLHAVMKPPFIARGRLGYAFTIDDVTFGAFGEVIENPARTQTIVRAGPVAGLQVSDHLDLFAAFAFVVASGDTIGLSSADVGTLGVRYRWASGEPVPVYMIP